MVLVNIRMAQRSPEDELCSASASGNLPKVLLLLETGAAINGLNTFRRTALQVAKLGNTELVAALLRAGADHTVRDPVCSLTVTHDTAREGFEDTMRVLLEYGVDVNATDERGNLPLHLAAREGHLSVVQLLIGRTTHPQSTNGEGLTAMQLAQQCLKETTARFIREHLSAQSSAATFD